MTLHLRIRHSGLAVEGEPDTIQAITPYFLGIYAREIKTEITIPTG